MARAQGGCTRLAVAKSKLYGFRPAKLSKDERTMKAAQLDACWTLVEKSGRDGARCLRVLLAKQTDRFAILDESQLLLSLH